MIQVIRRNGSLFATLLLAGSLFQAMPAEASDTADTAQGRFRGQIEDGLIVFRGIPYAVPPVGARRWQAPQPAAAHAGIAAAGEFGPVCLQPSADMHMSEDCLYLNVWTPGLDEGRRPVMVWVHGGGFRAGSGDIAGEVFAREDAVVVSINYRLGPLGFFAHESVPSEAANFGLLDMVLALEWVQKHIHSFGGDAGNVTIFGVSAGGMAVNMLMVSPPAQGLFHRAIAQSGYGTWPLPRSRRALGPRPQDFDGSPVPLAEGMGAELVARVMDGEQSLQRLRGVEGAKLVGAQRGFQAPIVDRVSLPDEPGILFMRGEQHVVPFLTGGNSNEGSVMRSSGVSVPDFAASFADADARVKSLYAAEFARGADAGWQRLFGDYRYLLAAHVFAAHARAPTWLYYVDFVPAAYADTWIGTPHGMDAAFLFGGHASDDAAVRGLAARMVGYWVDFARRGEPNGGDRLHWPASRPGSESWMVFGAPDAVREDVLAAKLELVGERYRRRAGSPAAEPVR